MKVTILKETLNETICNRLPPGHLRKHERGFYFEGHDCPDAGLRFCDFIHLDVERQKNSLWQLARPDYLRHGRDGRVLYWFPNFTTNY